MLRGVIRGALIGASRSGGISNFTSDDVIAIIFIFFIAFVVYYFYKKHASLQQKRQTLMNLENNTPMLGFSWRTDPNTVWKGVHQLALTDAKIASGILSCCGPYYSNFAP